VLVFVSAIFKMVIPDQLRTLIKIKDPTHEISLLLT